MQRSALCRSRRELSNAYLLANIGVDTAENEPLEVWGENSIQYSLHSLGKSRQFGGNSVELTADVSLALLQVPVGKRLAKGSLSAASAVRGRRSSEGEVLRELHFNRDRPAQIDACMS